MLNAYKVGVIAFSIVIFGFGFFIIQQITNSDMDIEVKVIASFSIGVVALSVIAYLLVLMTYFWTSIMRPGSYLILFLSLLLIFRAIWSGGIGIFHDLRFIGVGIFLFLILIARLAFLKHVILPGYSDSPIHYQVVFGFLHPEASQGARSLGNILNNYYHFGFHSLAAWLTSLTNLQPENIISLLGQLFLVIAPISIFFLSYVLTKDMGGAMFAGLLTATGWIMPAFSVNWGKFPAQSSIATMPAVLALMWLYWHEKAKKRVALFYVLILLFGITLLHTRIVFCVLLAALSLFLTSKLKFEDGFGFPQALRLSLLYVLSLWPLSQLLVDFYSGLPVLIVFLVLLPFAFQSYPKLSVGIFFYTFGLGLIMLTPSLLGKHIPTLIDRQFIEMMLYIPFSLMGGMGIVGLMKKIPQSNGILKWGVTIVLIGAVTFNFLQGRAAYPDACCDYVRENDNTAFQWIQENVSTNTLILIPTFKGIGTDAGVWISPLLGKKTNKLPFDLNWGSSEQFKKFCDLNAGDVFIYAGGRAYSFANAELKKGLWTKPVFTSGQTVIYQVTECPR